MTNNTQNLENNAWTADSAAVTAGSDSYLAGGTILNNGGGNATQVPYPPPNTKYLPSVTVSEILGL